jgi:hypothetical protein
MTIKLTHINARLFISASNGRTFRMEEETTCELPVPIASQPANAKSSTNMRRMFEATSVNLFWEAANGELEERIRLIIE